MPAAAGWCSDEGRLAGLEERLAQVAASRKPTTQLLVLHTLGNHGPSYFRRYPDAFKRFQPACENDDLRLCSQQEIVNAYDNALLYTDPLLASLVTRLRSVLAEHSRQDPDFWSESGLIEIDLYQSLMGQEGAPSLSYIANRYADLQRRAPARAEWRTVSDQLEFVLGTGPKATAASEAQQLLATIRTDAE